MRKKMCTSCNFFYRSYFPNFQARNVQSWSMEILNKKILTENNFCESLGVEHPGSKLWNHRSWHTQNQNSYHFVRGTSLLSESFTFSSWLLEMMSQSVILVQPSLLDIKSTCKLIILIWRKQKQVETTDLIRRTCREGQKGQGHGSQQADLEEEQTAVFRRWRKEQKWFWNWRSHH